MMEEDIKVATELLEMLDLAELKSLADYDTDEDININKQDLITTIINQTPSLEDLIDKKEMEKEHLYSYLVQKGNDVKEEASKLEMKSKILEPKKEIQKAGPSTEQGTSSDADFHTVWVFPRNYAMWFYELYNSGNLLQTAFSSNCVMEVKYVSPQFQGMKLARNCEQAVLLCYSLREQGLRLDVEPALCLCSESGDRRTVSASGKFTKGELSGTFLQPFMLVRDEITGEDWEIKKTMLGLRDSLHEGVAVF